MLVGERIRQRREELGLSMGELAEKLGYKNRTSIFKVEVKGSNIPNEKLNDYAKALNTTVEWLLGNSTIKDKELADYVNEMNEKPELKMLFNVTKDATKEDVETAVELIKVYLRGKNGNSANRTTENGNYSSHK